MRRQLVHARAAFDAEAHRGSSRVFGSTSSALRPALLAVALAMVTACEFRPDALVAFDASVGVDAPILELGARHDADAPDAGARDATNDAARDDAEPDDTADTQPADVAPGDGAEDDAAMPDGAAPDAAPDAAAPDAAAPDAAAPDAQPLDAAPMDARAPDAAPMDAAPMDARPPDAALDAGVDAGAIDGGCASPPWAVGPMPGVVATIPANIAQIDQPPLVADLDNDGMEEVALVSSTTGQLAIIDWPACSASPNITTALFFAGPGGIALAMSNGREVIASVNGSALQTARYDGPQAPIVLMLGPQSSFSELRYLTVHPDGTEIIAVGTRTGGGFGYLVPRPTPVVRTLGDDAVGAPAFLSGAPMTARYVITTATGLVIAQPDRAADIPFGVPLAPTTAPVALSGAHYGAGGGQTAVAYGSTGMNQSGLTIAYLDPNNPTTAVGDVVASPDRPVGEPIAYATPGAASGAGFFQLRESAGAAGTHVLGGCLMAPRPSPMMGYVCVALASSATLPGTAPAHSTPLTGYASNSSSPDLIVATQSPGRVAFYSSALAVSSPPVTLSGGAVATPASSTTFLSRYNIQGEVVFVALDGMVELVAWQRPLAGGTDQALWLQSRGGPRRAGRL